MIETAQAPALIGARAEARRLSVVGRLVVAALGSGAIYLLYLVFVAFLPYDLRSPGVYLFDILGQGGGAFALYLGAVVALGGLATVAWRAATGAGEAPSRGVVAWAIGPPVVFALILLLTLPLTSRDIFHYIMEGRTLVRYRANPYLAPPNAFPDDPLLAYSNWDDYTSPYGPIALLASGGIALVAGDSLFWNLFLFKLLALGGYLACGALIWAIGRASGRAPLVGAVFWLWNPLVLIEFAGAGHNDVLMLTLLLGGLWLALGGRGRWAVAAVAAAAMVKSVAIVVLPLIVWRRVAPLPGWRTRAVEAVRIAWPAALVIGATLGPFWAGAASFGPLRESGFFYSSSGHILRIVLAEVVGGELAGRIVRGVLAVALVVGYALILRRAAGSPGRLLTAAAATALLLIAVWPFLVPWYSAWAVALVAAAGVRRLGWPVVALCGGALLTYLCQLYWPGRAFVTVGPRSTVSALLYLGPFFGCLIWLWREGRLNRQGRQGGGMKGEG